MTEQEVLEIAQTAVVTLLWVIGPLMAIALVVGLIIALFQALTSIQEMTLTFVPKILLVFVGLIVLLPFMASHLGQLATIVFDRIANGG